MNLTRFLAKLLDMENELLADLDAVRRVQVLVTRLPEYQKTPIQQELPVKVETPNRPSMLRQHIGFYVIQYFDCYGNAEPFNYKSIQVFIEAAIKVPMDKLELERLMSWLYWYKKIGVLTMVQERKHRQASLYKLNHIKYTAFQSEKNHQHENT